jgi:subtilisin family serine protease
MAGLQTEDTTCMDALDLVGLSALMARTRGSPDLKIGLIDGPVATQHPSLAGNRLFEIPGKQGATCRQPNSSACLHGTFVAGILSATRGSGAPGICPDCTVLIRSIFTETDFGREHMPSATPGELAAAMVECIDAGARVINLSVALERPSPNKDQTLDEAFTYAIRHGALVVAAAGNHGTLGGSAITSHAWVIPVVACDLRGRPMKDSTLGGSIGRRGLSAPGDNITSLGSGGQPLALRGASVAVPFVTGAIALLWSLVPTATAGQIRLAITRATMPRRTSVVPPLLDARASYQTLCMGARGGDEHERKVRG